MRENSSEEDAQDTNKDPIVLALEEHRWNKRAAAEALGLSYRQLRYRISKLGLD